MRVTVSYDFQPEDAIETIGKVLNSLGIKFEEIEDDTDIHIDYEVPNAPKDNTECCTGGNIIHALNKNGTQPIDTQQANSENTACEAEDSLCEHCGGKIVQHADELRCEKCGHLVMLL